MFGHNCLIIFRGPSFVLSAVTTSLLVCVVRLFIWYVAVCCLCVCMPDLLVCGMFVCSQPNIPQTSTSGTHTHRQHTATYQINNLTTQTTGEVVTALSTEDGPLKMVKQL
jgi:hypothetical protein